MTYCIFKSKIKKITYNYYGAIDFSTGSLFADKFLIGSKINENSFISHRSAFEFYGFYNQMYNEIYVSSLNAFKPFEFDDISYVYLKTKTNIEVEEIRGVRVTSVERTIVDTINDSDKISDIEETLKCIDLISYVDEGKISNYLDALHKRILYKKVGYILSLFQDDLKLSTYFFKKLKEKSGSVRGYFSQLNKDDQVYIKEWNIYAYDKKYLVSILDKVVKD